MSFINRCLHSVVGKRHKVAGESQQRRREGASLFSTLLVTKRVRSVFPWFHTTTSNGGRGFCSAIQPEYFLGIETSCDDTAMAIVGTDKTIVAESISSQFSIHSQYGGIVPNLAQRAHAENFPIVLGEVMNKWDSFCSKASSNNQSTPKLKYIAVTIGPGLSPCLWVGLTKAREVAKSLNIPIVGVNHMEAHAMVARCVVDHEVEFPFMTLLVSGGHTQLLLCHDVSNYTLLGSTVDDSIGEALDKMARLLNIDLNSPIHPGAQLETLARQGNEKAIKFPQIMQGRNNTLNFSFSGLKSQAMRLVKKNVIDLSIPQNVADLAASYQYCAFSHILHRVKSAIHLHPPTTLVVAGGVARNEYLRSNLQLICDASNVSLIYPPPKYCSDNGVMIAWAAIERYKRGLIASQGDDHNEELECFAKLPLDPEMLALQSCKHYDKFKKLV